MPRREGESAVDSDRAGAGEDPQSRELLDETLALLVAADPADREGLARAQVLLARAASRGDLAARAVDSVRAGVEWVGIALGGSGPTAEGAVRKAALSVEVAIQKLDETQPTSGPPQPARAEPAAVVGEEAETEPGGGAEETSVAILPADADPDILRDYVAECLDHIGGAEAAILELESGTDDPDAINRVFRAFHTIKGTSGFLGLDPYQRLAHKVESLFGRARSGEIRITGPNADLALECCDAFRAMIERLPGVEPGEPVRLPEGYPDLVRRLAEAFSSPGGQAAATRAPVAAETRPREEGRDERAPGTGAAEAHAQAKDADGRAGPTADSTVRVDTARLDSLLDIVGELVILQSMLAHDPDVRADSRPQLAWKVAHAGKIVRELQDLTIALRMVPLKATFRKMTRLVRDLARKSGKPVRTSNEGEETEIDRNMVEVLADPLVHMVRNAVDHGIEPASERARSGKPSVGTIGLKACRAGGSVVIEVSDDGRGLDREKILAKARALGLVERDKDLASGALLDLIFQPGFSTTDRVTDLSGRGVGLDVVRKAVQTVRGRIEVDSRPGAGTTFTLRVPLTLAITDVMVLRVGAERYLLPTTSIVQSFRPASGEVRSLPGHGEIVLFRGDPIAVLRLGRVFDVPGAIGAPEEGLLVVMESDDRRSALLADELLGQQQVVIKSLGRFMQGAPGIAGGVILGDGRVALVLDPGGMGNLIRSPNSRGSGPVPFEAARRSEVPGRAG